MSQGDVGHIFIVGNSRSGTTMLGQAFNAHSRIYTFEELHFFEQMVTAQEIRSRSVWSRGRLISLVERLLTTQRESLFSQVQPGRYVALAEKIVSEADGSDPVSSYRTFLKHEAVRHGKKIPCEQTPRYLFFSEEILEAFPDAYIVNIVRDPRDVLLSQKNKWKRRFVEAKKCTPWLETIRSWANYHPYTISKLWSGAVRFARTMEAHPRFITVHFESLLNDPENSLQFLCRKIGLNFEPEMLNVPQIGSSIGQDRPEQKGINPSRAGSWRRGGLSGVELDICQRVTGKEMGKAGYELVDVRSFFLFRLLSMSVFLFKIALSLFFNIKRTSNFVETIKRRLVVKC